MARRKRLVIGVLIVAAVLMVAVWAASIVMRPTYETPAQIGAASRAQAKLTGGAKAYTAHCGYCHERGFAPSITGRDLDAGMIAGFARSGPGNMPAFPPSQVSDGELAQIAEYVNQQPVKDPAP